jgi:glyoxylase-like metal-dependent hydrolase (beta-lactamase superfamily II)
MTKTFSSKSATLLGTVGLAGGIFYSFKKGDNITKVLISHLHKDHAGGITIKNPLSDECFISFPYANYYVQQREFNKFTAAAVEDFQLLADFSKLVWLTENEGMIDGYIKYQVTGGHSIFHQVFWIEENNQTIFFGGDVAPQLQQMKSRFVAKYDVDGKKCMERCGNSD